MFAPTKYIRNVCEPTKAIHCAATTAVCDADIVCDRQSDRQRYCAINIARRIGIAYTYWFAIIIIVRNRMKIKTFASFINISTTHRLCCTASRTVHNIHTFYGWNRIRRRRRRREKTITTTTSGCGRQPPPPPLPHRRHQRRTTIDLSIYESVAHNHTQFTVVFKLIIHIDGRWWRDYFDDLMCAKKFRTFVIYRVTHRRRIIPRVHYSNAE